MVERQWKMMDFWSNIFWILIFPDSWEGEEIDLKATKNQKSNILINPRRPLVRILLLNCLKCLNLPIFEGLKLLSTYLIKLLHLVDFSCWGPKVRFLGLSRGSFGSNLRDEIASTLLQLKAEDFSFTLQTNLWGSSQDICSVSSSVPSEIPSQTLHLKLSVEKY